MAQVWLLPALDHPKDPVGVLVTCPALSLPQQVIACVLSLAQACEPPVTTWTKVPEGGVACPKALFPQQWTVPPISIPQVEEPPALT
jgi:hypothetical protein